MGKNIALSLKRNNEEKSILKTYIDNINVSYDWIIKNYKELLKSSSKPLIYLVCPYSGNEEENFQKVSKKAAELMSKGVAIYSPISMCHPMAIYGKLPENWEFWEKFDRIYLSLCNKMIVYRLPNWEKSRGVQAEIKIANEMGYPSNISMNYEK